MKRDFDFEQVGKKLPYQVPDGFFEDIQRQVMAHTCDKKTVAKKNIWLRISPLVAAVAAVLTAVIYLPLKDSVSEEAPLSQVVTNVDDTWIENMSDEDLEMMSDFTTYDMFMNQ